MFVLAVTGGLGSGKSTAAEYFASRGAAVIALDEVARAVLQDSPDVRSQVLERFGDGVVASDGRISRPALAQVAFGDAVAVADLNAIVHPAAIVETRRLIADLAASEAPPSLVVIEVPLLAEAPSLLDDVDLVLAIEAPIESRIARAVARGMTADDARRRIARQATDEERAAVADIVLSNDGDEAAFRQELARVYEDRIAPHLGGQGW